MEEMVRFLKEYIFLNLMMLLLTCRIKMGSISEFLMGMMFGISLMVGWQYMMKYRSSKRVAKHTPRINNKIPDANDATCDRERLSARLSTYGRAELQIEGDGNCQFRALADQLFGNPDYHEHVRKQVVKQLKHFKKLYKGYVPMKYKDYRKKMKKLGEWGDHVTLQAAADRFKAKICLVTSLRDTCYIEILPKNQNPSKEIWLSFWNEVHYNSLYETGEVPSRPHNKKKQWLF